MTYELPQPIVIDAMFRGYLQEALFASESKLRKIVEHSVDGVVVLDREGHVLMWNAGQERITGIAAGEALGKPIWELRHALIPAHRRQLVLQAEIEARMLGFIHAAGGERLPPSLEIELERPTGERRIVQQFTFIIPTADGHRIGCVFRDVTDLRRTARNLLRRNAELDALNRINRLLASSLDVEQVRKTLLKEVVELFDVTAAGIWLVDDACGDLLCVQSVDHTGAPGTEAMIAEWSAPAQRAFTQRHTLVVPAVTATRWPARDACGAPDAAPRTLICAPMEFKGCVVGVLLVVDEEPGRFDQDDVSLLESIAASAATAFENATLYQKAQKLAAMQERQRLAVSLHEAINQSLFSAGLIAEVLPRLIERDIKQASSSVQDLRRLLRGAVADLREVLADIQPPLLGDASFDDLLRQVATGYTGRTGTMVAINIAAKTDFAPSSHEPLYRLCREVFANIAKHAEATQVWVELVDKAEGAEITIRDNGRGFDATHISPGHFGLAMMQQLAARVGGVLRIVSEIGKGTEISVFAPYKGRHGR